MRKKILGLFLLLAILISVNVNFINASNDWINEESFSSGHYGASVNYKTGEMKLRNSNLGTDVFEYVKIDKEIDYSKNQIKWTVEFNKREEYYKASGMQHTLFLPKYKSITPISIHSMWNNRKTTNHTESSTVDNWENGPRRDYIRRMKADDFFRNGSWSAYNIWQSILNVCSGSTNSVQNKGWYRDLNKWMGKNNAESLFSIMLREDNRREWQHAIWTFTTTHEQGTDLDKVPMVARLSRMANDNSGVQVHAVGPVGVKSWIKLDYDGPFWVENKSLLTDVEKNNLVKEVREYTISKIPKSINADVEKTIKNDNTRWTLEQGGGKFTVRVYYVDGSTDRLDVTDKVKEKRKLIPSSEENTALELQNYWVKQSYIRLKLDKADGDSLERLDGKNPENFYYALKGSIITRDMIKEVGKKQNYKFMYWSKENNEDAFGTKSGITGLVVPNVSTDISLRAIYEPALKVILHNNKGGSEEKTKTIVIKPESFKTNSGLIQIPYAFYSNDKKGELGDDFKKKNHTFVGWTLEKNMDVEFGPHIKNDANFTTSKDKYGKYSWAELQAGKKLQKQNGIYKEPAYLPNGFKITFNKSMADVIKETGGVINLYANYRPYITVKAIKKHQNYDWDKGIYTDDAKIKKHSVKMGLIYRTAVTSYSDPTVHNDANYHTLLPTNYGGKNNIDSKEYENTVLKDYNQVTNNNPTWQVPGFDENGLRISYAVVEVTDTKNYAGFANNWANLGVEVFKRIPSTGEVPDKAPNDPVEKNKKVPKIQTVVFKNASGDVDAYTAATSRKAITRNGKLDDITGYDITIVNIPVAVENAKVDEITHGDKSFIIRYTENTNVGAKVVDKILVKYNNKDYELTRNYNEQSTGDGGAKQKVYIDTWSVKNPTDTNAPKFKAEFLKTNGVVDKSKIKVEFTDLSQSFRYLDGKNEHKDTMTITNFKGAASSKEAEVAFIAVKDAGMLTNITQEKNEIVDEDNWNTIVKAQIQSPTLLEAKVGTKYVLVEDEVIKQNCYENSKLSKTKLSDYVQTLKNNILTKNYANFDGDAVTITETKTAGSFIKFKIPSSQSKYKHAKTFKIISIEDKKNPVVSDASVNLDTRAAFERVDINAGSYSMKVSLIGSVKPEDYHDDAKLLVKYAIGQSKKTLELNLKGSAFEFKDVLPKVDIMSGGYTVEYRDRFGNLAAMSKSFIDNGQRQVRVVRPLRGSNFVYVNGLENGDTVTVELVGTSNKKTTKASGKITFEGIKFKQNDKVKVTVKNGNKTSNPYMVVVR